MKRHWMLPIATAAGVAIGFTVAASVRPDAYVYADVKLGGHLYDNWPKLKGFDPQERHPAYPAEGQKKGGDTWRCKECHGWDYVGKDGRYAKGSHYTGIGGVWPAREKVPAALYEALTAKPSHDFSAHLESAELWALVKFLREGLADIGGVVDAGGKAKGDPGRGKPLFAANCAECHGDDGNDMDFKPEKDGVQGVGWYAKDNPQESIHKYRWGDPGSDMPSGLVDRKLTEQQLVDILSYAQTLE